LVQLSESDKVNVLLQLLTHQLEEIKRREGREQQLFEWATGLLLAAFAAVIALSDRSTPLPYSPSIKLLATLLIAVPTAIIAYRILGYTKRSAGNAEAVERIESLLHLYEKGYYGTTTPYPPDWEKKLAKVRLGRRTPLLYSLILSLMATCVVITIWLIL
jgi:hypothetical protein